MMTTSTGTGAKRKRKTMRRISTLHLVYVDVVFYDFTLTKSGHLRKSMFTMIEEKQNVSFTRQTRSKTHDKKYIAFSYMRSQDNALINTLEDNESLFMATSGTTTSKAEE